MSEPAGSPVSEPAGSRLPVLRTAKLYLGGAFPRSESGRTYVARDTGGGFLANVAQGSRKDVRDAVVAARRAADGWARSTAYLRGQIVYRAAELLEGRSGQLVAEVAAAEGVSVTTAAAQVAAAVDRLVWYAGWSDKLATVLGSVNPVAGPYVDFSLPEPTGVVGVLAPPASSLLGLVSVLVPVMATGCTAVVVASHERPLPAVTLGEVLATSDVPAGVVNIVTGSAAELGPVLAAHGDVDALDLTGAANSDVAALEEAAADNLKRTFRPRGVEDLAADPGLARMRWLMEIKTVWHPAGT